MIQERQFIASIIIGISILILVVRLVQRRKLDIAYCWLWLAIGAGIVLVVTRYNWLEWLSQVIGAKTHTTTLFLLGFVVVLLLCLQFSLALSSHRRQIRKLTQETAMLRKEVVGQRQHGATERQSIPETTTTEDTEPA